MISSSNKSSSIMGINHTQLYLVLMLVTIALYKQVFVGAFAYRCNLHNKIHASTKLRLFASLKDQHATVVSDQISRTIGKSIIIRNNQQHKATHKTRKNNSNSNEKSPIKTLDSCFFELTEVLNADEVIRSVIRLCPNGEIYFCDDIARVSIDVKNQRGIWNKNKNELHLVIDRTFSGFLSEFSVKSYYLAQFNVDVNSISILGQIYDTVCEDDAWDMKESNDAYPLGKFVMTVLDEV